MFTKDYLFIVCFEALRIWPRALHKQGKHLVPELYTLILHKRPFRKSCGRIKTTGLEMKAFNVYLRPRSDTRGGALKEDSQLWRKRIGDPTPKTSSSRKTILIYRKKGNLTLSRFSPFVTWLERPKHGHWGKEIGLKPSLFEENCLSATSRDCFRSWG